MFLPHSGEFQLHYKTRVHWVNHLNSPTEGYTGRVKGFNVSTYTVSEVSAGLSPVLLGALTNPYDSRYDTLRYSRRNEVCHRDLKPENFLFLTLGIT